MIRSIFYNYLLKKYPHCLNTKTGQWLWSKTIKSGVSVSTKIYGSATQMPADYIYPLICRNYSTFNNPYLELVHQTFLQKKRPLTIIDAGAAIGDTFLLIAQNDPAAVNKILCIEGSDFFLKYLNINTRKFKTAVIINTLLSNENGLIPELETINNNSATATGSRKVPAQKLDSIIQTLNSDIIDVIKTDVEGFDGNVLAGSVNILKTQRPNIIFEFHPLLINKTGNNALQHFKTINEFNYETTYWFDKFGIFSHSVLTNNEAEIQYHIDQCLSGESGEDWHYDIIALPKENTLDTEALKICKFASNKIFPF